MSNIILRHDKVLNQKHWSVRIGDQYFNVFQEDLDGPINAASWGWGYVQSMVKAVVMVKEHLQVYPEDLI